METAGRIGLSSPYSSSGEEKTFCSLLHSRSFVFYLIRFSFSSSKMETAGLSQILIHTHEPTWRQIPEDGGLN
jgi:hypothetical protein